MLIREVTRQNLIEIILLPIVFVLVFISGTFGLIYLHVNNYLAYLTWCAISFVVVIAIIISYTYLTLRYDPMFPPVLPPYYGAYYTQAPPDNQFIKNNQQSKRPGQKFDQRYNRTNSRSDPINKIQAKPGLRRKPGIQRTNSTHPVQRKHDTQQRRPEMIVTNKRTRTSEKLRKFK